MHVRLGNVLDHDRNVVIPTSNGLIIGGGHEAPVLVNERDGIDRSEMLIVCLGDLVGSGIVLGYPSAWRYDRA